VIASRSSRALLAHGSRALLAAAGLLAAGCATPAAAPLQAMDPLPSARAYVPDEVDLALRDLGRALLAGDARAVDGAVERVARLDAERDAAREGASGALPYALDARHALIADPALYRSVSALLLRRGDLPDALRARLEQEVDDDPLALAEARLRDARTIRFGRAFNVLAEAAGRSFSNTVLLAYRVAVALVHVAVAERTDDPLSLPERQALQHWKQFVEQHPEAPEAPAVVARIDEAQDRWYRTQRDRSIHAAERALDAGDARLALAQSERAVRYAAEDVRARELLARAERETAAERERLSRSEGATLRPDATSPGARKLALALLASPRGETARVEAAALPLAEGSGPEADEARFALALAAGESGERERMWDALGDLADRDSPLARHASAAVESPEQNPYRFWRKARRAQLGDRTRFVLFGPLADGPRDRPRVARPVEWLLELPALVPMLTGLPQRLVRAPFLRDERRSPAVFAARYLEREPAGEHAADVRGWLVSHEERRGNAAGALALVEADPAAAGGDLARLRVEASRQVLDFALREQDLPTRVALLRRVGREYEGTPAAREAVAELRRTVREATPQHIRISRGFLTENPAVAGPDGLALRRELLDGDAANGELHPDGVALLGGREIEVAYLGESGDPRDAPVLHRQRVSEERVQRMVAVLEEASLRKVLTDPAYPIEYDADRDLFFERARLGLAASDHPSLEARSSYAFRGMRERYGLVRRRESILPVELVLQGSIQDLTLGAFPRIRLPKRTPDAFLFE
jgi:hypothetical protein